MDWNDVKRTMPKCPGKSIYQYRSDIFPVWWRFNGYGGSGHGYSIAGKWDYVFTFAPIEDPTALAEHVKDGGMIMYRGQHLNDHRFACLHEGEYKVYKKVL